MSASDQASLPAPILFDLEDHGELRKLRVRVGFVTRVMKRRSFQGQKGINLFLYRIGPKSGATLLVQFICVTYILRNDHTILHLDRTTTKTPRFLTFPSASRFANGMNHAMNQSSAADHILGRDYQRLFRISCRRNTIIQANQTSNNPVDLLASILSCPPGISPISEATASRAHFILKYVYCSLALMIPFHQSERDRREITSSPLHLKC